MSANKKKIRKLTDAQYNEYIAALRREASLEDAENGRMVLPQPSDGKDDEGGK